MRKKTITISIIAILTVSSFGILFTMFLTPVAARPADLSTMGPYAMDATPEMIGEKEVAFRKRAAEEGFGIATGVSPSGEPVIVGDSITISVSDMGADIDYDEIFVVIMDGVNGIILIEEDAYINYDETTDEYVFANPNDVWREEDRISTTKLTYLLNEFDTNIYTTVTGIFGPLGLRGDNKEDAHKVWILIHNIRDESYYDPAQTSYVAGYFSASENFLANKSMFHIDSYDWQNRIGPDGARPYLYEGVFAHEFEHMVHFDQDPDEPSWVDEGLADLAGYLSGYGHSSGHLAYYLVYHDTTALTFWGGRLEDYGASYLFQLYLYEKFGGAAFVSALVQDQANGIEGIQNNLPAGVTFDEVYDAWTIAVYLDDITLGSPYGFDTLDIGTEDTWRYSIRWVLDNFITSGLTQPPGGWFGGGKPYTAQYYRFGTKNDEVPMFIYVEGDRTSGPGAFGGSGLSWSSGVGAWSWRSISQTFNLTGFADVTLDFYTYFEIEWNWDYGYVEVYDQTDEIWTTLNDPSVVMYDDIGDPHSMVDYIAHAQDNPNTDDGREPISYNATGTWHAFTGASDGWIPVSMDLTPFAGHIIDLYFTTWQDGAYTLQQMYVDNISITADGSEEYSDDVLDEILTDWDTTPNFEGGGSWSISSAYAVNNWQATYIETFKEPTKRNRKGDHPSEERELVNMHHFSMYEDASWFFGNMVQMGQHFLTGSPIKNTESQVLIISNRKDHILPAQSIAYFGLL
ncbi:hypothetical protein LCGC14_1073970 [marine sediment metagenome]|uniref:Uncharacterized protein n=1 Tax=marine sediment metagenome TaxID=412755 RepID=A0A0F9MM56_9ZZZZ